MDFQKEAAPLIQGTIDKSGLLHQMSSALFRSQDIAELDRLASELKQQILNALKPFYKKHMGLYVSIESLKNPSKLPEPYCEVNGCILRDGKWIPLEKTGDKLLIVLKEKKNTAA